LAAAHDFISKLPLGYMTPIGEQGLALSGGQKQRVAIARALYRDPAILIFDEATSALDTESESLIQQNIGSILQGRTSIIIAHRLSTIRDADRIVVFEQGEIAEEGTHDELLERRGIYYQLVHRQVES
jgi:ATP-binding cassette subfamily B protein